MDMDDKQYRMGIIACMIVAICMGLITSYLARQGENTLLFVPLLIGMVFVFVMYHFVEGLSELRAGSKVDDY